MKNKTLISILLICVFLCSCAPSEPATDPAQTEVYLIPNSHFEYTGSEIEGLDQYYIDLGTEFCTDAEVTEEGLKLELTQQQRDNLIQRNNDFMEELRSDYHNANELYTYEPDAEYRTLHFYYDEKLPLETEMMAVFGTISGYGLNQILLHHDSDWHVDVVVYNCHTGKEVVSMRIPDQVVYFGGEEWSKSYEE